MAKGKKSSGKHYVSKGERPNVKRETVVGTRRDNANVLSREVRKLEAWSKGKNFVLTVANPNPNEKNKPFLRVNGPERLGKYKKYVMKSTAVEDEDAAVV